MTSQFDFLVGYEIEFGNNFLDICDAIGIKAFDNALDIIWDLERSFLNNLKILNGDKRSRRCHKGNFIDFFFFEVFVMYFNDALGAKFFAFEVDTKQYLVFVIFEV